MRRTFKDDTMQRFFEEKGYAVVDFLSAHDVEELERIYYNNRVNEQKYLEITLYNDNYELNKKISDLTGEIISDRLKSILDDHIFFYSGYITKIPRTTNEIKLHQDPSFVDETRFRSLNIWSPLCEVNEKNGAFHLVEGTHNLFRGYRGYTFYSDLKEIEDEVVRRFGKMINVRPGQGIVYDHALFHYSFNNETDKIRIANTCFMIPRETKPYYYHNNRSRDMLELYEIDSRFMLTYFSNMTSGDLDLPLISRSEYAPPVKVSINQFEELINKVTA